jgi:hypothetical protein
MAWLLATISNSIAADYANAFPMYKDGKCSVVIWIHNKTQSRKIEYQGQFHEAFDSLCHVEITGSEFEKDFEYCSLSGFESTATQGYAARFSGGPAGGRDKYWFEWRPANKVHPDFLCLLREHD